MPSENSGSLQIEISERLVQKWQTIIDTMAKIHYPEMKIHDDPMD